MSAYPPSGVDQNPQAPEPRRKRRKWPFVIGGILVVALFGAVLADDEEQPEQPEPAAVDAQEAADEAQSPEATEEPEPEAATEEPEPEATTEEPEPEATTEEPEPVIEEVVEEEPEMSIGQRNAISTAENYLDYTAFSRTGLIEQLEFEEYATEDATFAVDHLDVDWDHQAAAKAEDYLDFTSFSRQGLIDQLLFEGFTQEQAEYGVTAVGY